MSLLVKDANTTTQSLSTGLDSSGNLVPVHAPAAIVAGIAHARRHRVALTGHQHGRFTGERRQWHGFRWRYRSDLIRWHRTDQRMARRQQFLS